MSLFVPSLSPTDPSLILPPGCSLSLTCIKACLPAVKGLFSHRNPLDSLSGRNPRSESVLRSGSSETLTCVLLGLSAILRFLDRCSCSPASLSRLLSSQISRILTKMTKGRVESLRDEVLSTKCKRVVLFQCLPPLCILLPL